jgi:hypothetical protein
VPIVQSYEVTRGRTSELDRTGTGTATIKMFDTNGSLDPAGGGTGYDPMTPVAIGLLAHGTIFTGHIARWSYDLYESEEYGVATLECVDGMDVLAAAEMTPDSYGDPADYGNLGNVVYERDDQVKHRIDAVLTDVGWPAGNREVFTGNCRLQKTVYAARQPAVNAITDAADAEFPGVANFFMGKTGKATFHGRLARFNPTDAQYHITTWLVGDTAAFTANNARATIFGLDYDRDKDRIINSALATPEGISDDDIDAQRVEDAASISQHRTRSWSAENLILEHSWLTGKTAVDECREVFATYYTTNYAQPQTQVRRVSFRMLPPSHPMAGPIAALMGGIDISDRIQLTTANGFNAYYFVEGLHYEVRPASDTWLDATLDLDLSPAAYWNTLPS